MLLEEIQALRDPYRSVLYLRFYEDLEPAEIAERSGTPAATTRSQLARGLELLRVRLDERFEGGRSAWCAALAPMAGLELGAVSTSAGAALGLLIMKTTTKWMIAAVLAGSATLGGLWLANSAGDPASAAQEGSAKAAKLELPPSESAPAVEDSPAGADGLGSTHRKEVSDTAEPPRPALEASGEIAKIEATVVGPSGSPIEGAELRKSGKTIARSDPRGEVHAVDSDLTEPRSLSFEVSYPGLATRFLEATLSPGKSTHLGEIRLSQSSIVAGRVIDDRGNPIADAQIWVMERLAADSIQMRLQGPRVHPPGAPGAKSESDGTFKVTDVSPGIRRVWAGAKDRLWTCSKPIELLPQSGIHDLELKMEPIPEKYLIEGTVVDADGKVVPNATLRISYHSENGSFSRGSRAESNGRFRIFAFDPVPHTVTAKDPRGMLADATASDVAPGSLHLELRLLPARLVRLVAKDPDGEPIREFTAEVLVEPSKGVFNVIQTISSNADTTDPVHLRVPASPFKVHLRAVGFADAATSELRPDTVGGSIELRLQRVAGIVGHVMSSTGPVSGAKLRLVRKAELTTEVIVNGYPCELEHNDPAAQGFSGKDGAFVLQPPEPSNSLVLLAEASGFARSAVDLPAFHPSSGLSGIVVRMSGGGAIEGVVRGPANEVAGTIVGISRHDGYPDTQRVGADGKFRFSRLTPGRWNVETVEEEALPPLSNLSVSTGMSSRGELPTVCEVQDGSTTRYDIDLAQQKPCTVRGELRVQGERASGWSAQLLLPGDFGEAPPKSSTFTDRDGIFRLSRRQSGNAKLFLSPPDSSGFTYEAPLKLIRGEVAWAHDFRFGRIQGTAVTSGDATTSRRWELRWRGDRGEQVRVAVVPDHKGAFVVPRFPAGKGWIWSVETTGGEVKGRDDGAASTSSVSVTTNARDVGTFTVMEGETLTLDLK